MAGGFPVTRPPVARAVLTTAIVGAPLLLLLAPAIHYALDTPIGLLERSPELAQKFDSPKALLNYFVQKFTANEETRVRPVYDLWNGMLWKVFGETAWPHHLVRWLLLFGAVGLAIAAFGRVTGTVWSRGPSVGLPGFRRIVPVALLAYFWLLFPTSTTVRIENVELYTMFFLGVCNFAAALMLTAPRVTRGKATVRHHALFLFGFLGLVFSKEVNIAPAIWLVIGYVGFVTARGMLGRWLLVGSTSLTMVLALAVAAYAVYDALDKAQQYGTYYGFTEPFLGRFTDNAAEILRGLFQWETSALITMVLVLAPLGLLIAWAGRVARHGLDAEGAFILLVLGEWVAMFLVLGAQWGMAPRYWSVLIPGLATLLAFAAKFAFTAAQGRRARANAVAVGCVAFIAFFAAANYHSFLHQVLVQHSARNLDDRLLARAAALLNAGEYLQGRPSKRDYEQVREQFNSVWNHRQHWPDSPYGVNSLHQGPPEDPRKPYYILDFLGRPGLVSLEPHTAWAGRSDYDVLRLPRMVATLAQGGPPHVDIDVGMLELGDYRWAIHAVPHNMAEHLRRVVAGAGERIGDGFFEVHSDGAKLTYVRRQCEAEDTADWFFLHFHPVHEGDLPPRSKPYGFQNDDFPFSDWGVREGTLCVAVRSLPAYPVKQIQTGQYVLSTGVPTWRVVYP